MSEPDPTIDQARGRNSTDPSPHVGLVFALRAEAGGLVDRLGERTTWQTGGFVEHEGQCSGKPVVLIESGVGRDAAARATERLIEVYHPQCLISAGFAGALVETVRRRDLLMADSVLDADGSRLSVDIKMDPQALSSSPGLHVGPLLTVDELVRTPDQRQSLHAAHGALAVDMETYAVAEVCRRRQIRFLAVRVVSDGVDDVIPPEIRRLMDQKTTAARMGAALGAVIRRPSSAKDMWRLKEEALKASDHLAQFLTGVVSQL